MSKSSELSHLDQKGQPQMVDVGDKKVNLRQATAEALVVFPEQAFCKILAGDNPKGGIIEPARIAGIQAAKKTADLIPMCHQLPLDSVAFDFTVMPDEFTLKIQCCARATAQTGVEMEAMVGASNAALVIYDMTKALSKGIEIKSTRLLEKSGGKSGPWQAQ